MAVPKWFDVETYFKNKVAELQKDYPDGTWTVDIVKTAFVQAGFSGEEGAYQHFLMYGNAEGVSPNALFDPDYYYHAKAASYFHKSLVKVTDDDIRYIQNAFKENGFTAWDHYQLYGSQEGINPSAKFDANAYLEAKALALHNDPLYATYKAEQVHEAIQNAGMTVLEHYLTYAGQSDVEVAPQAEFPAEPLPNPKPDTTPDTKPEPQPEPTPDPDPQPEPEPEPEPSGQGKTIMITQSGNYIGTDDDDTFIATSNEFLDATTISGGKGYDILKTDINSTTIKTDAKPAIEGVEELQFAIHGGGVVPNTINGELIKPGDDGRLLIVSNESNSDIFNIENLCVDSTKTTLKMIDTNTGIEVLFNEQYAKSESSDPNLHSTNVELDNVSNGDVDVNVNHLNITVDRDSECNFLYTTSSTEKYNTTITVKNGSQGGSLTTELDSVAGCDGSDMSGDMTIRAGLSTYHNGIISYKTGSGNDKLDLGTGSGGYDIDMGVSPREINIDTGDGNDLVKLETSAGTLLHSSVNVATGNGNDTVQIDLENTANNVQQNDLKELTINGGAGDDSITLGTSTQITQTVKFDSHFGHDQVFNFSEQDQLSFDFGQAITAKGDTIHAFTPSATANAVYTLGNQSRVTATEVINYINSDAVKLTSSPTNNGHIVFLSQEVGGNADTSWHVFSANVNTDGSITNAAEQGQISLVGTDGKHIVAFDSEPTYNTVMLQLQLIDTLGALPEEDGGHDSPLYDNPYTGFSFTLNGKQHKIDFGTYDHTTDSTPTYPEFVDLIQKTIDSDAELSSLGLKVSLGDTFDAIVCVGSHSGTPVSGTNILLAADNAELSPSGWMMAGGMPTMNGTAASMSQVFPNDGENNVANFDATAEQDQIMLIGTDGEAVLDFTVA